MDGRIIILGDVHGCWRELKELLKKLRVSRNDRLYSVGDLIGKGPNTPKVLDWAMKTKNLRCVLGNHEQRFLRYWRKGLIPDEKLNDLETVHQMGRRFNRYMRFISRWPLYIRMKECLIVHAGFDPRRPLSRQPAWRLTNIRRLEKGWPWYKKYKGKLLVAFGHWARRKPLIRKNAAGLDTGCVYGGRLTALILPERKLASVKARKAYQSKESWK